MSYAVRDLQADNRAQQPQEGRELSRQDTSDFQGSKPQARHHSDMLSVRPDEGEKDTQYGNYVSFIPLSEAVTGLTLTGFKYNLSDHTLTIHKSLATSNEILADSAHISYRDGYLLCIEALE